MTADDFNARNIEEFRANHGRLGGNFEGAPVLLLHSIGAKGGEERVNPMMWPTAITTWCSPRPRAPTVIPLGTGTSPLTPT